MKKAAPVFCASLAALCLSQVSLGQVSAGPRRQLRADIPEIVKRAFRAQRNLKFQGRRVVTMRREGKTSSFEDLVWTDGKSTRVEFPPGSTRSGQIIVESKGERQHYFPVEREIEVAKIRIPNLRRRAGNLGFVPPPGPPPDGGQGGGLPGGGLGGVSRRPGAKFSFRGNESVARINCQVVDAEGPFGGKIRLWIDPQSAMLLKRESYDRNGELVSGFEFRNIEIGVDIPASKFSLSVAGARRVTPADRLERVAKKHGFAPMRLPSSYPFVLDGGRFMKADGKEVFMQMYSGDEGRFSLFRVRGTIDPQELQKRARGLRSLTWERNGESFALVGDVDEGTLNAIAREFGKP